MNLELSVMSQRWVNDAAFKVLAYVCIYLRYLKEKTNGQS